MVPAAALMGLLGPFNRRGRGILVALLRGYSLGMAAANAGITLATIGNWQRGFPEFREAVVTARDWGFRRTAESELQRRAMAGATDRHSGRLLELWVKREDHSYRESKGGAVGDAIRATAEVMASLHGGWEGEGRTPTDRLLDVTPIEELSDDQAALPDVFE